MKQFLLSTLNTILAESTVPGTLVNINPRPLAPLYALRHLGKLETGLFSNEAELEVYLRAQYTRRGWVIESLQFNWRLRRIQIRWRNPQLADELRTERWTIVPFQPVIE